MLYILGVPAPANAYIDPNIGGQLAQILGPIVTILLGAIAFARHWVRQTFARFGAGVKAVFRRVFD